MSWTFGPLLPAAPILLGATGPVDYTETATVAGAGAVTAPDSSERVETATVAATGSVSAQDFKPQVETATVAGAGAATAADVAGLVETATVAGSATVVHDEEEFEAEEQASVYGSASVSATDIRRDVETATVAAEADILAVDVGIGIFVETGTVAASGAATASDAVTRLEVGSVAAEPALVAADSLGCIEAATAFGEASVTGFDEAVIVGFVYDEMAAAAGEGAIVYADFRPFYSVATVGIPFASTVHAAVNAQVVSGGKASGNLPGNSTRSTVRTEGN